jgi:hypothetical protein
MLGIWLGILISSIFWFNQALKNSEVMKGFYEEKKHVSAAG